MRLPHIRLVSPQHLSPSLTAALLCLFGPPLFWLWNLATWIICSLLLRRGLLQANDAGVACVSASPEATGTKVYTSEVSSNVCVLGAYS